MRTVEKSVLVHFSAARMYALVERVEDYPQFLPWCGGATVLQRDEQGMEASIEIRYHGIHQQFTTRNTQTPNERIEMRLKEGPFSHLEGDWIFTPLKENACKIEFRLSYAFSNGLLERLIGPMFHYIANTFVESFIKRAEVLHGS